MQQGRSTVQCLFCEGITSSGNNISYMLEQQHSTFRQGKYAAASFILSTEHINMGLRDPRTGPWDPGVLGA